MTIAFTVPGQAVPWARSGGGVNTPRFTPAKQRSYAGVLKLYCQHAMNGTGPMLGPLELSIVATYAWPKSWSNKQREAPGARWKTSRPDADNLTKIVKDALNTVAWQDDAQVASSHTWKRYGDAASLTVRIEACAG